MGEKRGRRGKEKSGVNKRYPSQFLSSCLGGTAAHVSTHTHTHTHTHTRARSRQPILPMADTDTAMQREMKGGREGASEQAGRERKATRGGEGSGMERRRRGTETEKT